MLAYINWFHMDIEDYNGILSALVTIELEVDDIMSPSFYNYNYYAFLYNIFQSHVSLH